ncbi:helix-turn-helix transcriptional regulator [Iocasia frigidifontis]|uniref:helix-turn-helix transcriptional regulator n=1 Tax=Iocasia fonsfrigidae TaxID=2682810 RepID=UPI001E3804D0|nr:helix-turn-helix transcriptional regulator [Iocasia fonsfrigidae]
MRKKLINKRNKMKLTQAEVAKKLDITRAFYGHIETGKRNPTLKLAKKIADFYGENVDTLFFNKKGNESYPDDQNCA